MERNCLDGISSRKTQSFHLELKLMKVVILFVVTGGKIQIHRPLCV